MLIYEQVICRKSIKVQIGLLDDVATKIVIDRCPYNSRAAAAADVSALQKIEVEEIENWFITLMWPAQDTPQTYQLLKRDNYGHPTSKPSLKSI